MAQRTIIEITDDLNGEVADETIHFAFDGKSYSIDLSAKNAEKFRKAISTYVNASRREGAVPKPSGRKSTGRADVSEIRAWAKAKGYAVSERGRISREIQEAYDAA